MGLDDAANRLDLPYREHSRFHRILEQEFNLRKLPSPNSSKASGSHWRTRFLLGDVTMAEVHEIRAALIEAARKFDIATMDQYKLTARTRAALRLGMDGGALAVRATRRR